ncbi:MAG: OmpA family protein [Endomicrobia bacterium]|nr:OmpA family protein [Endomicrobiia bacterium]MCL2507343.1 OmpA family protein [Endomicrobiia bacterium]
MKKSTFLFYLLSFVLLCGGCAKNKNSADYSSNEEIIKGTVTPDGKIVVKDVKFEKGSDKLSKSSHRPVRDLAKYLKHNTKATMNVTHYETDDGTPSFSVDLSKQRADVLAEQLKGYGISRSRINYIPVAPESDMLTEEPYESIGIELIH